MARELPLIKTLRTATTYKTEDREVWIIKRIGTDYDSPFTIRIDKKDVLTIRWLWAPLVKSSSNVLGPFDLGDLFLVVPPETEIVCGDTSGYFVKVEGKKLILEPGESPPGDIMSRFYAQTQVFWELVTGAVSLGTDVVFAADSEVSALKLKTPTAHEYKLVGPVMVSVSGGTWGPGDFSLLIKKNGVPVENVYKPQPGPGVDVYFLPAPPTENNYSTFKFEPPIELPEGHEVEFLIRNVSGADKAPSSGSSWTFTVYVLTIHKKPAA